MGFKLITKNETFNPADYGLKVGDIIHVVTVGGGAGGGCSSANYTPGLAKCHAAYGGNGGTTSFGSHLTALGGGGGAPYVNPAYASYFSQRTQGFNIGGYNTIEGGGGAGGWLPEFPGLKHSFVQSMDMTFRGKHLFNSSMYCFEPEGTGGVNGSQNIITQYYSNSAKAGYLSLTTTFQTTAFTFGTSNGGSSVYITDIKPRATVCGGMGSCAGYSAMNASLIIMQTRYFTPLGGIGYGAGGASAGYILLRKSDGTQMPLYGGYGGNSGEIKEADIKLTTLDNIVVSIGGGGSGAAARAMYDAGNTWETVVPGADGTSGSAGTSTLLAEAGSNAGGYGDIPYGGYSTYNLSLNQAISGYEGKYLFGGGGGASGCVAIWW